MGKVFNLYINLQDKNLDFSLLKGKKFIISLCPSSLNNLTVKDIKNIQELLKKGCILGQRGDLGRCKYPHDDGTEPWHENLCLHNPSVDFEEQYEFMIKGRNILEGLLGKVEAYCPTNHLYDINTIKIAQILKYNYFMDKNLQDLKPYENNRLIILPESKEKGEVVYFHHEDLGKKEAIDFLKNNKLILPDKLELKENQNKLLVINEIKKKIRKLERDLKKLEG
jgi:hypothetical protein